MFANLGSDHPGLIEALAQARAEGRRADLPELIVCPHGTVALSAAHAYAAVSGEPQAVLVHVDAGTQNLGGAVHNAARGRIPVLIFAGAAPYTMDGELPGSRNEFIHWLQDVRDQRGILRNYTKYDNEIRTGRNVKPSSGSMAWPPRNWWPPGARRTRLSMMPSGPSGRKSSREIDGITASAANSTGLAGSADVVDVVFGQVGCMPCHGAVVSIIVEDS
jgi:hypothetical protein